MDKFTDQPGTRASQPLPNEPVATPCFVIFEDGIKHNLKKTDEACGGVERFMPHVKTHRAPWIVKLSLANGVTAFKCATTAEVEMVLEAGVHRKSGQCASLRRSGEEALGCATHRHGRFCARL